MLGLNKDNNWCNTKPNQAKPSFQKSVFRRFDSFFEDYPKNRPCLISWKKFPECIPIGGLNFSGPAAGPISWSQICFWLHVTWECFYLIQLAFLFPKHPLNMNFLISSPEKMHLNLDNWKRENQDFVDWSLEFLTFTNLCFVLMTCADLKRSLWNF